MGEFTSDAGLVLEALPAWHEGPPTEDAQERSSLVYLAPAAEARTVRLHPDGKLDVSAGTFAGGKEAIGGFTIVEADSLEEAVEIGKRHRWLVGSNEVREIKAAPGLASWIRTR